MSEDDGGGRRPRGEPSRHPGQLGPPAIAELGERFGLDEAQLAQLAQLAAILGEDERAPTTVREPRRILEDHLADALVALDLSCVQDGATIADIGAGAGIPGIPLALARPRTRVTLVDGNGRKCEFMRRVVAALGVENADVVHARAEAWNGGVGGCDIVTARALASLDVVAEYAAPLLRIGGCLVAWRGRREPEAEAAAQRAAEVLGLAVGEVVQVRPYPGAEHRHLHVFRKVSPTPSRFPRRAGIARKRPLGGLTASTS